MTWNFISPRIVFGEGALDQLENVKAKKAFVVTDKTLVKLGYVETLKKHLERMAFTIFDKVEPGPSYETAEMGGESLAKDDFDLIIGLGGGSVMDTAKAIRVLYENPGIGPGDIMPFSELRFEKTRLVLIPTTSGTGSEVTTAIVLTDRAEGRKTPTMHPDVGADLALVDPRFIWDLPKHIIADTGMDALMNSIDAYLSSWKNELADGLAIKSMLMILNHLLPSYEGEMESRAKMHVAATVAGLAFANSGTGLSHTLGHPIEALFRIPHGRACGICFPYALRYELQEVGQGIDELSDFIGIGDRSDRREAFIDRIRELMDGIGIPPSLKEAGIDEEEFHSKLEKLTQNALMDSTVSMLPSIPSEEEFMELFRKVYYGYC
jgi:alcohol dehydrogenase class IV